MAYPAQVVLLGNSHSHLSVRAAVLKHFWRVEIVAVDAGETPKFNSELLVVCSSIAGPERQNWVDRARAELPALLIVRMDDYDAGPLCGADAAVEDEHGPGALVSAIYELLTERGLESREWPRNTEAQITQGGWVQ
jgi:hypothetical protein